MAMNSFGNINLMQPMGGLNMHSKCLDFFSFKFFLEERGWWGWWGDFFFSFSFVPNMFPSSSQWVPITFPKCSFQVPNVFPTVVLKCCC